VKNSSRNGFMLVGSLRNHGFDWWWHSLVGVHAQSGAKRPFFIEYYVINPALGGATPILGQLPAYQAAGIKPAYAMLKAGTWGKDDAVQIHNFYGIDEFTADAKQMNVRIGPHTATETHLKGAVELSEADAEAHPEYMSQAGTMSWDLRAEKVLTYSVGPGASRPMRALEAFRMFWHVQGMLTRYEGEIVFKRLHQSLGMAQLQQLRQPQQRQETDAHQPRCGRRHTRAVRVSSASQTTYCLLP